MDPWGDSLKSDSLEPYPGHRFWESHDDVPVGCLLGHRFKITSGDIRTRVSGQVMSCIPGGILVMWFRDTPIMDNLPWQAIRSRSSYPFAWRSGEEGDHQLVHLMRNNPKVGEPVELMHSKDGGRSWLPCQVRLSFTIGEPDAKDSA